MKSLFFLGRQPALGLAELESLYGADAIAPLTKTIAISNLDPSEVNFARHGGSIKMTEIIDTLHDANWKQIEKVLTKHVPQLATSLSEGKIQFGLSVHDVEVGLKDIQATALRLKKMIRAKTGQSVRVTPNQAATLSTAQVIHNHLTGPRGLEIVLVKAGSKIIVSRTIAEQDIEAYTKRDQARPKRDARVGMLPPKLAQTIINLSTSPESKTVLDPFCGTGVVLQEAMLMGYNVYGSDIEKRMVEYSQVNLEWLEQTHELSSVDIAFQVGDATAHTWNKPFDTIACEGYLGQPFNTFPDEAKLREVSQTCNMIAKKFLKNIATQIDSGTRLCIALPAWHKPNGSFIHLKLLDELEDLGYNRMDLQHVRNEELLYYRPDQVVARELLIITRK